MNSPDDPPAEDARGRVPAVVDELIGRPREPTHAEYLAGLLADALPLVRHCAEHAMKDTARGAWAESVALAIAEALDLGESRKGTES